MWKIALPNKGRLSDDIRSLLRDAGLDVRSGESRALMTAMGEDFVALFVRAQDVPRFVADGAADAGITGLDCIREASDDLALRADLGLGSCRLVLAAPLAGPQRVEDLAPDARVATSFPKLTRGYFEGLRKPVRIVEVSGAAEVTPQLGVADAIVDLVSSGSTLRGNGLVELSTILSSTAQLVSRQSERMRPGAEVAVEELALALTSVLRARGKRYLMANAPRAALPAVAEILPGLNGPTVVDSSGSPFVAVHAVVDTSAVYRTTVRLKAAGCEGILVTRIERVMP